MGRDRERRKFPSLVVNVIKLEESVKRCSNSRDNNSNEK